jgi:outer membrane protein TolC
MKIRDIITAVAMATAFAATVRAQSVPLTLDEAVQRAVEHNPDLAVVKLSRDVGAAQVGQSASAYTPLLSATVGRSSNDLPPTNFLLGTQGVTTRDLFSTAGVRQRVPFGNGVWSASWQAARTTSNNPLNSFDPSVASGFQLAYSQPLLKDRKIDAASTQYIIAKRNEASSDLRFREAVVQTVAAVKQAYWTLKALRANVGVQQQSLALAEELERENTVRVRVGQSPPIDVVQVQSEVAQRRESLISARAAADDAEDRLRRLIIDPNDPSFWQAQLDLVDEPAGRVELPDLDALVAKAQHERYDILRAKNDLGNATTNIDYHSNQRLPDVRLEASYAGSGVGGGQLLRTGGFPGTVTGTLNSGFGSVLGQTFGTDYPTWSFGVTISHPIGRSYEDLSKVQAEVEHRQAAHRIASLQLDVATSLRQTARQVRSTAEREDAARAGATLAQERLDTEQRRFEVGLSTTFLVTQAQRDLLQAQVNLLQAMLDYQSSLVTFEALQLAPGVSSGDTVGVTGAAVQMIPTPTPQGAFRLSTAGLPQ